MDKHTIYRKSASGTEALATRDAALGVRLRSLLILVDGKRDVGELCRLAQSIGDAERLLTDLDDLGMIESASRSDFSPL
ncbi:MULTISPECIES: hypothetical protein [Ramlibacter]|uniref:Uncharacterized protein n=1 Tax=Ramlibacter pinisoli TaxID=2682844 RepID=A0A6N8IR40_9BURK|nr:MULTISPECIES: hypothetical protein [Ramlibacter]MBA2963356.1 hypothetical protein [Ramlibacter sp. CGMCC 1.13660]MVQ28323.1 hypothetical protein [Ramlibacter pinisoli]